jgi:surface antigen
MAWMPFRYASRWRITGALALIGALVTLAPAPPAVALHHSVTAGDYGYPYPSAPDCNEQTGANCKSDQWGFTQGQCHSWFAYRINQLNADQLNGLTFNTNYKQPAGQTWGGTIHWADAAQRAGIVVNDTPALGAAAWWSTDGGHVGYVEAVNVDGTVTMSEMNADYHNGFDFTTLQRGGRWPTKFIHIADRPAATAKPGTPTQVHADPGSRRATISWTAPADNGSPITGYRVTASVGGRSVKVAAGVTTATMRRLQQGTSYTFTVRAINANGHSPDSAPSNAVVPTS